MAWTSKRSAASINHPAEQRLRFSAVLEFISWLCDNLVSPLIRVITRYFIWVLISELFLRHGIHCPSPQASILSTWCLGKTFAPCIEPLLSNNLWSSFPGKWINCIWNQQRKQFFAIGTHIILQLCVLEHISLTILTWKLVADLDVSYCLNCR